MYEVREDSNTLYWVELCEEPQYGPFLYAAEAQEKADELNEANNNETKN